MKYKSLLISFLLLFVVHFAIQSQTPRFAKYEINHTGYYAYFPSDPGEFDVAKSDDSLNVYTKEITVDSINYGLILVDFKESLANSTKAELEDILTSYLDFLYEQFNIVVDVGFGKGHTMESNPDAQGVIDYWTDAEGTQMKVKGWIDPHALAVLYIYSENEVNINIQDLFLNGFRFKVK